MIRKFNFNKLLDKENRASGLFYTINLMKTIKK